MLKHILLLLSALFVANIMAQESAVTLGGALVDGRTQGPLPYMNLVLRQAADSTRHVGTYSDMDGRWTLTNVPPGEHVLQVSGVGYAPL